MRDGWAEVRLGDVLVLDNSKLGEHDEEPVVFSLSKYDGVVLADDYFDKRIASDKLDGYKVLGPGGWAYSTIHIDEGSIATNHHGLTGVLSPMYTTMRWVGQDDDPRYFELLLRTPRMLTVYRDHAAGTVNRRRSLAYKAFAELRVDVPPLVVQRRVVDLVDAVDTYAARTTDQVKVAEACLGALRRMLIDESDAPLVDFSEVATIESALVDPTLPGYRDLPHLGIDRIESRTGRLVGVQTAADDGVTSGKFLFTEEDVIYSKIRPELRKAAFPRYEGLCSADAYPLRPAPGVDPHYLLELLLSDVFGDEAIGRSSRTKMPKINRRELADIRVPCPDPDEQRQIGELLHSVRVMRDAAAALGETLATIRSGLLGELLSGDREIPGSYDELVGLVA